MTRDGIPQNTYLGKVPTMTRSNHPTQFVMFPSMHGKWQVSAIPPTIESFAQKKSFPVEWAGLGHYRLSISADAHQTRDAALSAMLTLANF